jgi:hypothetical protein
LIVFGGVTDRLIPLFAIGAFLAFTLSQAGMVLHWKRTGGRHARKSILVNAVGATATGITVLVVLAAKFMEGAWITVIMVPLLLAAMVAVRRHYESVAQEIAAPLQFSPGKPNPPLVVLPVQRWSLIAAQALRFALNISPDVRAVHIECAESDQLVKDWQDHVARPARESGLQEPLLAVIESPYRFVITPILTFILNLEQQNPGRIVAVVIPELVESRWYHYMLHNQRAYILKTLLMLKGNGSIVIVDVPWYLDRKQRDGDR